MYNSIVQLIDEINKLNISYEDELSCMIPLLELLEKINFCNQEYELVDNNVIISYKIKLNLFHFRNIIPLRAYVQIIGLPISLCLQGYFGNNSIVEKAVSKRKGLKVLLNSNLPFKGGGKTLSTFVFENRFTSFNDYLNSLRSPYRRRINKALKKRNQLYIQKIKNKTFSEEHYNLYLSIMNRTDNPLETLPIDFFKEFEATLYEFIDSTTKDVIGFIQLKEIKNKLYFLFGGFKKEDVEKYDIYYNMLLKIIEVGIEKQVEEIELGQTAEESKLKIGCKEKYKYLYIHHSNPILNFLIQRMIPLFSYKSYPVKHRVFKAEG